MSQPDKIQHNLPCACGHHCHEEEGFNCVSVVPIFQDLTQEEMDSIHAIATTTEVAKGDYVYQAGDSLSSLYVLYEGSIKLTRITSDGREQVLRVLSQGDFLGELSLFSQRELTDNAIALENSILCTITGDDFRAMMLRYPMISMKVMDVLSRRLDKAEETIEGLSLKNVEERVAFALLELAQGSNVIHLPFSKGDLASQIGTSQETLSRRLSKLEKEGLIRQEGQKTIILLDLAALQQQAGQIKE